MRIICCQLSNDHSNEVVCAIFHAGYGGLLLFVEVDIIYVQEYFTES